MKEAVLAKKSEKPERKKPGRATDTTRARRHIFIKRELHAAVDALAADGRRNFCAELELLIEAGLGRIHLPASGSVHALTR
jgi:hypothetical protein